MIFSSVHEVETIFRLSLMDAVVLNILSVIVPLTRVKAVR